jgi:septum site-determining protein MinC
VSITAQSRSWFRIRGRSFMAFVLAPEPPLGDWMAELDAQLLRSEGFFLGRPVVLDVSRATLTKSDLEDLISALHARDIRIIGVEGTDPSCLGPGLPPLLKTAGGNLGPSPCGKLRRSEVGGAADNFSPAGQSGAIGAIGSFSGR